jgi:hypothetical protein
VRHDFGCPIEQDDVVRRRGLPALREGRSGPSRCPQWCGKLGEVDLGLGHALREGSFQPKTCFRPIALARNAAGEITAKHQLGIAVAQLGGGAEPS